MQSEKKLNIKQKTIFSNIIFCGMLLVLFKQFLLRSVLLIFCILCIPILVILKCLIKKRHLLKLCIFLMQTLEKNIWIFDVVSQILILLISSIIGSATIFVIHEFMPIIDFPESWLLAGISGGTIAGIIILLISEIITKKLDEENQRENELSSNTFKVSFLSLIKNTLQRFFPKTWLNTRDSLLDTIETFPDEVEKWEKRNLKYVAYLVVAWDLLGFIRYFIATAISNAIATRRVSS